jgi:hypothetical protein
MDWLDVDDDGSEGFDIAEDFDVDAAICINF